MRAVWSALCSAAILSPAAVAQQAWVPVWADEFNGTTLDLSNWQYQTGTGAEQGLTGWGNNELQYYTTRPENISVANGLLTITARAESFSGSNYTSARIRSFQRREFTYGRFEARMKVPAGAGLWPAFWMLPTNSPYGGWAAGGEIDLMETINLANSIHGTIHHGGLWPQNVSTGGSLAGDWDADFHIYTVEWEPDAIRWYVDGQQFFGTNSTVWHSTAAPNNPRAPFDTPFHFLLNLAVGGNWPGPPNGTTPFPSTFQVDYVRVLQRPARGPYSGQPAPVPSRIEAENYDLGGGSIAYNDNDAANVGGAYRVQEAVDLQICDEGGFNVGWFASGEWIEYTINVPRAGQYELRPRIATPTTGCSMRALFNGVDRTGQFPITPTTGWQTYRTQRVVVDLEAGVQVMRVVNAGAAGRDINVNWIELLVPGDVDGNGRLQVDDLPELEKGTGVHRDVDADGVAGTAADRTMLIGLLRGPEKAAMLAGRN